jgi:hypothetical protein
MFVDVLSPVRVQPLTSFASCLSRSSQQRHFLEQDFEALGLDDAIPIKVRRDSAEDGKADFSELGHHRASEGSSGPYEEIAAYANLVNAQGALARDEDA